MIFHKQGLDYRSPDPVALGSQVYAVFCKQLGPGPAGFCIDHGIPDIYVFDAFGFSADSPDQGVGLEKLPAHFPVPECRP